MRVFVTGASGLIGQAVTKELLNAGHTVLGLARSDEAAAIVTALGADVQKGSLSDLQSLREGASASDGVIHLAFVHDFDNYEQSCEIDRQAIRAMADALKGSNRPLITTSGTMLLPAGRMGTEDDTHDLATVFAERGESETLTRNLASERVRAVVVRLAPVNHGLADNHMFLSLLISAAGKNGVSIYVGNGLNRWPAVHYQDTAAVYRLALEKGSAGSTFHSVAEEGITMEKIAEVIGKKLGLPVESRTLEEAQHLFGTFGLVIAADNPVSSEKTREELGWCPAQWTLLEDLEHGDYFRE